MISILFALKLFLLIVMLATLGVSYFHARETRRMEKRLGLPLPKSVETLISSHLGIMALSLVFFGVLFLV